MLSFDRGLGASLNNQRTISRDPNICERSNFWDVPSGWKSGFSLQGRYANAEALYIRSLATEEKILGLDYPSVAISLTNLASLYHNQGRYADAEPL